MIKIGVMTGNYTEWTGCMTIEVDMQLNIFHADLLMSKKFVRVTDINGAKRLINKNYITDITEVTE